MSASGRVRNPQKIREGRCSKFITEGFVICGGQQVLGIRPPPPNAHRTWLCHADILWVIVSTFALLGVDSGFTAISSGVRESGFRRSLQSILFSIIFLWNRPQTKAHVQSQFISEYGKACRFTLYGGATTSPCGGKRTILYSMYRNYLQGPE